MIEIQDLNNKLSFCPLHESQQFVAIRFDNASEKSFLKCLECIYQSGTQNTFRLYQLFGNDRNQVINGWPILSDDAFIYENLLEIEQKSRDTFYLKENSEKAKDFFKQLRRDINNLIDQKEQFIMEVIEKQQLNYENIIQFYNKISKKEEILEIILDNSKDIQQQNQLIKPIIESNIKNQESNKQEILKLIKESKQNNIDFDYFKLIQNNLQENFEKLSDLNNKKDFSQKVSSKDYSQITCQDDFKSNKNQNKLINQQETKEQLNLNQNLKGGQKENLDQSSFFKSGKLFDLNEQIQSDKSEQNMNQIAQQNQQDIQKDDSLQNIKSSQIQVKNLNQKTKLECSNLSKSLSDSNTKKSRISLQFTIVIVVLVIALAYSKINLGFLKQENVEKNNIAVKVTPPGIQTKQINNNFKMNN